MLQEVWLPKRCILRTEALTFLQDATILAHGLRTIARCKEAIVDSTRRRLLVIPMLIFGL
jgi:hypothetical protein